MVLQKKINLGNHSVHYCFYKFTFRELNFRWILFSEYIPGEHATQPLHSIRPSRRSAALAQSTSFDRSSVAVSVVETTVMIEEIYQLVPIRSLSI